MTSPRSWSGDGVERAGPIPEPRQGPRMSREQDFKKRVREHAEKHGMSYQAAREQLDRSEISGPRAAKVLREKIEAEVDARRKKAFEAVFETYLQGSLALDDVMALLGLDADGWPKCLYKLAPPDDDRSTESADEAFDSWTKYAEELEKKLNKFKAQADPFGPLPGPGVHTVPEITEHASPLGPQAELEALTEHFAKGVWSDANLKRLRHEALRLGEPRVFASLELRKVHVGPMDEETFAEFVGRPPRHDDLERVNCLEAGDKGHFLCGWCSGHEKPRFECGCPAPGRS